MSYELIAKTFITLRVHTVIEWTFTHWKLRTLNCVLQSRRRCGYSVDDHPPRHPPRHIVSYNHAVVVVILLTITLLAIPLVTLCLTITPSLWLFCWRSPSSPSPSSHCVLQSRRRCGYSVDDHPPRHPPRHIVSYNHAVVVVILLTITLLAIPLVTLCLTITPSLRLFCWRSPSSPSPSSHCVLQSRRRCGYSVDDHPPRRPPRHIVSYNHAVVAVILLTITLLAIPLVTLCLTITPSLWLFCWRSPSSPSPSSHCVLQSRRRCGYSVDDHPPRHPPRHIVSYNHAVVAVILLTITLLAIPLVTLCLTITPSLWLFCWRSPSSPSPSSPSMSLAASPTSGADSLWSIYCAI